MKALKKIKKNNNKKKVSLYAVEGGRNNRCHGC